MPSLDAVARVKPDRTVSFVTMPPPAAFLLPVATPGGIWLSDAGPRLTRIDASTGEVTIVDIPPETGVEDLSNGVAIDVVAWFSASGGVMVAVDDAGAVVGSVPQRGSIPRRAVVDGGYVWVVSEAGGLERIPIEQFTVAD